MHIICQSRYKNIHYNADCSHAGTNIEALSQYIFLWHHLPVKDFNNFSQTNQNLDD